ncbi:hypothetical protein HOF92_04690, partial [bacterium]|nr:hypothetical protein [bacterium]
ISIFMDGEASVGIGDSFRISADAMGLLAIEDGIALTATLSADLNLGSVVQFEADFALNLNTFGEDYIYEVPDDLQAAVGYDTVVISGTGPGLTEAGFYVSFEAKGSLTLLDILDIKGEFAVVASLKEIRLDIEGTIDLPVLEPLVVAGTLGFGIDGLYGSLQVGGIGDSTLIDGGIFTLKGSFLVQINTTSKVQRVKGFDVDENGDVLGTTDVNIEPLYLLIDGSASLEIASVLELEGSIYLEISTRGIEAELKMSLDLGAFGQIKAWGAAAFLNTEDEGVVFAMSLGLDVKLGVGIIGIEGKGVLEINSSDQNSYAGVAAGTTFKLSIDGALNIFTFEVEFAGSISIIDGIFELRVDNASLDFFGFVKLGISGYIRSDGQFELTGKVDFDLNLGPLSLDFGFELTIGTSKFAGRVWGSVGIEIDLGLFEINETLAGFEGEVEVTAASAYMAISITAFGVSVSQDKAWSWGAPPVIAHQSGDTLYLHSGQMGQDLRGDLYKKVINETYHIQKEQDGDGILVRALGEKKTYQGVKKIIARGGEGNDVFIIDPDVDVEVDLDGEDGADILQVAGGKAGSVVRGGSGKDILVGGAVTGIKYYGDGGNDSFLGGEGGEIIDLGTGTNSIVSSGGDDTIYITSGSNTVDTGRGADKIYISHNTYTDLQSREGNDLLVLDTFASTDAIELKNHRFKHGDTVVDFDDHLEHFKVKDTAAQTTLSNGGTEADSWGSTDLTLEASGVVN